MIVVYEVAWVYSFADAEEHYILFVIFTLCLHFYFIDVEKLFTFLMLRNFTFIDVEKLYFH